MSANEMKLSENKLDEILGFFDGNKNEKLNDEVEFKCIVEGCKTLEDFEGLIKEIKEKLGGKIEFDGELKDKRYYDTENKNESYLFENGIKIIRIREEKDKIKNKRYIFTVKKLGENDMHDLEYEKEVSKDYKKYLIQNLGLKKIKESKKRRVELSFDVKVNGTQEKVKIAFDKYTDPKNKIISAFFEVEGRNEQIVKTAYDKLKKLDFLENKKIIFTTKGAKDLEQEQTKKNILDQVDNILKNIQKLENFESGDISNTNRYLLYILTNLKYNLLNVLNESFENETIYKTYDEFFKNIKKEKYNFSDEKNLDLINNFGDILKFFVKKKISKNDKLYTNYFHRIITNDDPNKKNDKKFDDKIEREYKGYIQVFLKNIFKDLKEKKSFNNQELKHILNKKINILLKILLIFDDSLTKQELGEVFNLGEERIESFFKSFENNLEKLKNEKNSIEIWEDMILEDNRKVDNSRVFKMLYTGYSRATAFSAIGKDKNIFDKNTIEKKLKIFELEQFEFLERRFSHWLNSPKRDKKEFEIIKNLFLENFYHIFLLSKTNIAFSNLNLKENQKFNQEFINFIFEKYSQILVNKENFLVKDKGPELLEYLIKNIFKNNDKLTKNIILKFKEYNKQVNKNILKSRENISVEKILANKFQISKIDFKIWQKLKIEPRIKILFKKILNFDNNGINLKSNILSEKRTSNITKVFKEFIEYEFGKYHKKSEKNYKEKLKKYIKETEKQFKSLQTYFKDNNIENLINKEKLEYLALNDANSFHLLISWFQYNLKDKKVKQERKKDTNFSKKVKDYSLHSETFSEKVLNKIGIDYLENDNVEFITSTSSAYNTSVSKLSRIIELHDRIGNGKPINVLKNFSILINSQEILLKDLEILYLKQRNIGFSSSRKYLQTGLEVTRKLLDGEEIQENPKEEYEYFQKLQKIDFPINDEIALKKLLEFQKYVYKIILPFANDLHEQSKNTTNKLVSLLSNFGNKENINYIIANPKSFPRIVEKALKNNGGNIEQVGDSARGTMFGSNFERRIIYGNSFDDLSDKAAKLAKFLIDTKEVASIRFEDKFGNPFKKGKRENGYRDASFAVTLKTGETIEIQFQLDIYYHIKKGKLKINDNGNLDIYSENGRKPILGNINIKQKLEKDHISFTQEEKDKIINYLRTTNKKIPKHFALLFNFKVEESLIDEREKFNADYTYNLERTIGLIDKNILEKLKILDRILFDIAAGITAKGELERIL